jgi:hypothetical protein
MGAPQTELKDGRMEGERRKERKQEINVGDANCGI